VRSQRIDGENAVDRFGAYSIEVDGEVIVGATGEVADLNNDGFLDLIVGAGFAENGEDIGKVYIFFGDGTGRFDGSPILSAANADIIIVGANPGDFFGAAVALSDINGDGRLDLVIGAPGTDFAATNAGSVYVFLNQGGPNYFPTSAAGATRRIDGNQAFAEFGSYVAAADFNNDGRPDLAVGAPLFDVGAAPDAGAIFTFFNLGAPNFFVNSAASANQTIFGAVTDEGFGVNILPADINNDGFVDLVVGSPLHSPSVALLSAGAVYVFLNNGAGSFPTSITTASQTITGSQAGMQFGACIDIADLGGDGDLDLIAGAPQFDPGGAPAQGALFIFFNSGTVNPPFFGANSNLADWRIDGENPDDFFGQSCHIANMDQMNGPDILVGATRFDVGLAENVGAVYLFLNAGGGIFPSDAANANLRLVGEEAGDRFGSGIKTGDLTNDGTQDLLIGARLANFGGEDSGSIYVFIQQQPQPPLRRRAPHCEKVKVDRVICDEIFYVEDDEFDIPIGEIRVPTGSTIDGVVTVTVTECDPRVDFELNRLFADVVFMVQKELTITTPDQTLIPLEFGFRLERALEFRKCFPFELEAIDPDLLVDLECHIVRIAGTDNVTLNPSTIDPVTGEFLKDATFDEELTILVKVKLIQERQLILQACSPRQQVDIEVATTPNTVVNSLSKSKGKD
jgi:hypothetical protein